MLQKIVIFFCTITVFCRPIQAQTALTLNTAAALRMTLTANPDGSTTILTTGADPFVSVIDIPTTYDYNTDYYISFDYISTAGLDNLTLFYGAPSADRRIDAGAISASATYKTMTINLKRSPNWTVAAAKFRFDFGTTTGQSITIKNLQLRAPTATESANDPFIQTSLAAYTNTAFPSNVTKVKVEATKVKIDVAIPNNMGNLFLCELRMYDSDASGIVAFSTPLSSGLTIQTSLDRVLTVSGVAYDRIYSRWVVAEKNGTVFTFRSNVSFADDVTDAATAYYPEIKPEGLKGTGAAVNAATSDLVDLGVKNVTVNLVLTNNFISLTATSVSYVFNGQTYYFVPSFITNLDATMQGYANNGITPSIILLIPINPPAAFKTIFTHPDADPTAIYSMANLTNITSFRHYAAAVAFVASRYNITNWIIHNEVDAADTWTSAGNKTVAEYMELYDRSMRTVYYTARQFNPASKVFISLTHGWTFTPFYSSKAIMDILTAKSKEQGDYEWGLAYHPYPQNLSNFRTWNDANATLNLNTSVFITPKNIELIDTYMRLRTSLYEGQKVRSLLLSEQGIHTATISDATAFRNQAAGVAYMWKKFSRLPTLEAIHYHRRVDNSGEGGFLFGLWTQDAASTAPEKQDFKKKSWYTYQSAGTATETAEMAFALPIIGVSSWTSTYNPIVGEVFPYKTDISATYLGASVTDVSIVFNGETHQTPTGTATFFNGASSNTARKYRITKNGQAVWADLPVTVSSNQSVSANLDPLSNFTAAALNSSSIQLNWQDRTDFEKGFVIEFKLSTATAYSFLATVPANQLTYTNTGLLANKAYDYRIYAFNDTVKTLYSNIVSATTSAVTPVSLVSFTANVDNKSSRLNWLTASEINNDYFQIERSADGLKYAVLGTVKSQNKGNSQVQQAYVFYDNAPFEGINYYRLKQVDTDGKNETFGVRTVNFEDKNRLIVKAYPNPSNGSIFIQIDNNKGKKITVVLRDITGKIVHSETISTASNSYNAPLSIKQKIAIGQYILNITSDNLIINTKIVVQ